MRHARLWAVLFAAGILAGCGRTSSDSSSEVIPWPGYAREEAGDARVSALPHFWTIDDAVVRGRVIDTVWGLELETSEISGSPMELLEAFSVAVDIEPTESVRVVRTGSGDESDWIALRTGTGVSIGARRFWHGTFTAESEERLDELWGDLLEAMPDDASSLLHEEP